MLSRIVSLVPERLARVPSGTRFALQSTGTRHPERLEHLALQLSWLTPLMPQDKESQQRLGLLNAAGRPVMAADDGDLADLDGDLPSAEGERSTGSGGEAGLAEEAEDAVA
jgi:hypothetical protein